MRLESSEASAREASAGARAGVRVAPVRTRADRRAFIDLPYRLHRADPLWVPPLRRDVDELLDPRRHPFYRHAEAELFVARDAAGRVVGRVAAIKNDLHVETHREPVGFFGFFECERDVAIAAPLFDAAAAWLAARGLEVMRGPASPSLNEECGLLVDGYDTPPTVMMPHNPPWYRELVEACGFVKAKDLLAYLIPHTTPPERIVRAAEALSRRYGLVVRSLDKRHFWDEVAKVRHLYNASWETNWGFVPMTEQEIDHLARQLKPVVEPSLVAFAEVKGELAGFALALPDLNVALKAMNGDLLPFGWAKGLLASRRIRLARVLTLGVRPEFRRTGAAELLYVHLLRAAEKKGMKGGEGSWVLEDNWAMRAALEKMGGTAYKTYRLYDRPTSG